MEDMITNQRLRIKELEEFIEKGKMDPTSNSSVIIQSNFSTPNPNLKPAAST